MSNIHELFGDSIDIDMSDDNVGGAESTDIGNAFVLAIRQSTEQVAEMVDLQWRMANGWISASEATMRLSILVEDFTYATDVLALSLEESGDHDGGPDSGSSVLSGTG